MVTREVFEAGDTRFHFAIESISKVFTMALAMEHCGVEMVREKIGVRPAGLPFNSVLALEPYGAKPLSPLVNAGAIANLPDLSRAFGLRLYGAGCNCVAVHKVDDVPDPSQGQD